MKVVLANIDYERHMTDEGNQFQIGLRHAGWTLCGVGYDGLTHVPDILERYKPTHIVVHDKRDWSPECHISFRKDIGFTGLSCLARNNDIKKFVVVKDAGTFHAFHEQFVNEVNPTGVIVYYHKLSVLGGSPFLSDRRLVRTRHSVNKEDCDSVPFSGQRADVLVSGARGGHTYPIRSELAARAGELRIDLMNHPGYANKGSATPRYLESISRYKAHICSSSVFGFSLRKIIESIAMGCVPITDLPKYDNYPYVNDAIERVPRGAPADLWAERAHRAAREWDFDKRKKFAELAREHYDYRAIGWNLSKALES